MDVCYQFIYEYILGGKSVHGKTKTNRSAIVAGSSARPDQHHRDKLSKSTAACSLMVNRETSTRKKPRKLYSTVHCAYSQFATTDGTNQPVIGYKWSSQCTSDNNHISRIFKIEIRSAIRAISAITSSELTAHNALGRDIGALSTILLCHMLLSSRSDPNFLDQNSS